MPKFTYEISVEASSEKEAETKIKALTTFAQKLTAAELAKMEHILKNDPVKTAFAKKALGV